MATGRDVLYMLKPNDGWTITGDDYDSIIWDEGVTPITRKAFNDGFATFDAWKENDLAEKTAVRQAILDRLGLTADEVATLLA
jgi:hypothetical protein